MLEGEKMRLLVRTWISKFEKVAGECVHPARNILSPWLPIGPTFGIFSVPGFLLVARLEYSQSLVRDSMKTMEHRRVLFI
jgi:hypothetical protein